MKHELESLESLTAQWVAAKAQEQSANKARLAIEAAILGKVVLDPESTKDVCGLKIKTGFTRKVDPDLASAWDDLTEEEQDAIKWVPEVVLKNYRALPPEASLHSFVVTKPAKPSFSAAKE